MAEFAAWLLMSDIDAVEINLGCVTMRDKTTSDAELSNPKHLMG